MATRYLIVNGDIAKPIPERMAELSTHTLDLTDEQMKKSGSTDAWKVVDGQPVLKTDEERQVDDVNNQKKQAKKDADRLYKELRKTFYIVDGETYEFDVEALLLFDSQVKNKESDIKVKEKGKKIKKTSKVKSIDIMTKVSAYLESISEAYNADYDLIDALDFTMPNLMAIKVAQEALKGE
jgi:hypothetical protein